MLNTIWVRQVGVSLMQMLYKAKQGHRVSRRHRWNIFFLQHPFCTDRCWAGNGPNRGTTTRSKLLRLISTAEHFKQEVENKSWSFFPESKHALQEKTLFCSKCGCWGWAFAPSVAFQCLALQSLPAAPAAPSRDLGREPSNPPHEVPLQQ